METFEYFSARFLDRMDQMLDKIDRICSNEAVKQEQAEMEVYEINLKGI